MLALLAVVSLASRAPLHGSLLPRTHFIQRLEGGHGRTTRQGSGARSAGAVAQGRTGSRAGSSGATWPGFTALGLLLAIVLVALLRRYLGGWRLHDRSEGVRERRAGVREAVEVSLEDVRSDPNVRRALIAAYRLMEQALARAGLPRRAPEAPREYLRRALGELEVGEAAPARLTSLFERAKFSPAPVDDGLREDAVAALLDLRAELGGSSA